MQTSRFDSEAWKAQRGVDETNMTRYAMVSSLERELHPGMPRERVLELLGPPDSSAEDGSADTYLLGIGFSPDPQYLKLTYKNGLLVSNARLVL